MLKTALRVGAVGPGLTLALPLPSLCYFLPNRLHSGTFATCRRGRPGPLMT